MHLISIHRSLYALGISQRPIEASGAAATETRASQGDAAALSAQRNSSLSLRGLCNGRMGSL